MRSKNRYKASCKDNEDKVSSNRKETLVKITKEENNKHKKGEEYHVDSITMKVLEAMLSNYH